MKKIILISLIISSFTGLWGQEGSLSGNVLSEDAPLSYAAVRLEGPDYFKGKITDQDGKFLFEAVPAGAYLLRVSLLGYKAIEEEVVIKANEMTVKEFTMKEDRLNLDEVVVSGTRYELGLQENPVMVKVLSPRLLNATQSFSLSEGLNYQPGVRVENNCQNCGFTQVRLNGLDGPYSQILINSRPVFSALNSIYGLEQIPVNIIERVEVVRSGGSALYGSNAIAGTINIITKEPVLNTWQVSSNFALTNGEQPDNTVNFNASLVADDLNSGATFYGMFRDREAFDANGDGFTEITALENKTLGARVFFKPGERNKLTFNVNTIQEYRRGGDRLELAPHFTDITEELTHNTLISGLDFEQFSESRKSKFSAFLSAQKTERRSFYGGLGGGRTAEDSLVAINAYGRTDDLALVGGLQFSHQFDSEDVLVLGVENQFNDVEDNIPGYNRLVGQQVNALGFFGQYEWKLSNSFTALLGLRYDRTDVDGIYDIGNIARTSDLTTSVLSPRLTFLYDINENLQLRGGYARGFRAPQAFNEDLHISSVGGEPQFVILSENLEKELSDAFTASINYSKDLGKTQSNFLLEGFYTQLRDPFTIVSTGSTLPNGSILEEVRNGEGAHVAGFNFEASISPSSKFLFQVGGTVQRALYEKDQILFEPEEGNEVDPVVSTSRFIRNPNVYGYLASNWSPTGYLSFDLTGAFTGSMVVPRVVNSSGFLELVDSPSFFELNFKVSQHFELKESFHLELMGGVQNIFNSFQDDFDVGPERDSDYVYGPFRPRTFFIGIKVGDFH